MIHILFMVRLIWRWVYGKVHSGSEKGNLMPPLHGLLLIAARDLLYPGRIAHTMTFVKPIVKHWLE